MITLSDRMGWTKGSYFAYLAPWGAGSLVQGKDYSNSLTLSPDLFPNSVTMKWQWPEKAPTASGVYNFNSINFGNYNFTQVATPIAPSKVKDIASLTQTQSLKLGGDGSKYDVITDFFLTSKAGDQSTKVFEVQVFLHTPAYSQAYVQSATGVGTYTDAQGRAWTVAIDHDANLAPDILLMPRDGRDVLSGSVDIKDMLDWLTDRGVLTGNEYFNGLGMGVEARQGSGTMTVNNFAVDYGVGQKPSPPAESPPAESPATERELTLTRDHYDAAWKMTRTTETNVLRVDGAKQSVEQQDAAGRTVAYTQIATKDGKEVIQHFDAKWGFKGMEVITSGAKTVTSHYDETATFTGQDVFFFANGRATEQHYDENRTLIGTDVGVSRGNRDYVDHYDARGTLTGHDVVFIDGANLVTQHFHANWKFASAEVATLSATRALNHDAMTDWLLS